jgi:hypothetical protein
MSRALALLLATVVAAACVTAAAAETTHKTQTAHKTKHVTRHWHGYGFLPGYRPPEVAQRQDEAEYWRTHPHYYGPAWPRFYHGRWNGGGFGPCYTYTPIGYMWTCGQ